MKISTTRGNTAAGFPPSWRPMPGKPRTTAGTRTMSPDYYGNTIYLNHYDGACDYAAQGYDMACPLAPTTKIDANNYDKTIKQTAVFGELTYNITDAWAITAGARWFQFDRAGQPGLPDAASCHASSVMARAMACSTATARMTTRSSSSPRSTILPTARWSTPCTARASASAATTARGPWRQV